MIYVSRCNIGNLERGKVKVPIVFMGVYYK